MCFIVAAFAPKWPGHIPRTESRNSLGLEPGPPGELPGWVRELLGRAPGPEAPEPGPGVPGPGPSVVGLGPEASGLGPTAPGRGPKLLGQALELLDLVRLSDLVVELPDPTDLSGPPSANPDTPYPDMPIRGSTQRFLDRVPEILWEVLYSAELPRSLKVMDRGRSIPKPVRNR